ncbi:MAG: tRNA pseudouridine(13) synthase TruD [Planctomycetes bacterium]|nr:tRNA pseudouridine(13) synthase TruD [Planctomycetota bacterium]MCC7169423.1 tRNA pseudouridine(13) synthase TruD [Planctomycetota bacterium]
MKPSDVPFVTADIAGSGGRIRVQIDDFRVDEIPLYAPSGSGEHLYVTIEKRGLSTMDAADRLARALRLKRVAVGFAGLKDARAITTQTFSLGGVDERALDGFDVDGLRVVGLARHRNKLQRGHLAGNRFRIRIRDARPDAHADATRVLKTLAHRGVPNAFGEQRFGRDGQTHRLGRALLDPRAERFVAILFGGGEPAREDALLRALENKDVDAVRGLIAALGRNERYALEDLAHGGGDCDAVVRRFDKALKALYASAFQSELFNEVLRRRFAEFDRLIDGDLAWLHRNGAVFLVEDARAEAARAESFEVSPSGPLVGSRMTWPAAAALRLERTVLADAGVDDAALARLPLPGARRALRIPVGDVECTSDGADLEVAFALPAGAYATTVLREIMKTEPPSSAVSADE